MSYFSLNFIISFYFYGYFCLCIWLSTMCIPCTYQGQKKNQVRWNWMDRRLWATMWVLGTCCGFSEKATLPLSHCVNSPAPCLRLILGTLTIITWLWFIRTVVFFPPYPLWFLPSLFQSFFPPWPWDCYWVANSTDDWGSQWIDQH